MPSLLETMPLRKPALARGEAALLSLGLSPEEQDQVKVLLASAADPDAAIHYLVSLKPTAAGCIPSSGAITSRPEVPDRGGLVQPLPFRRESDRIRSGSRK